MKPKLILCLALVLLAGLAAFAESTIVRLQPANIGDTSFSVKVDDVELGKRFTVFYKTNGYTLDEFLHARVDVCSEDHPIASIPVQKTWTQNGVQFEFTVSTAYLAASKFTTVESAHMGNTPMPAFDEHWFYLRDFVTSTTSLAEDPDRKLTREITAILNDWQKLKPGITRAELLKSFTTEGGISTATHRTFVHRRCPYIKVDVDLLASEPKQHALDERPTDTVKKISKPYLEWSVGD